MHVNPVETKCAIAYRARADFRVPKGPMGPSSHGQCSWTFTNFYWLTTAKELRTPATGWNANDHAGTSDRSTCLPCSESGTVQPTHQPQPTNKHTRSFRHFVSTYFRLFPTSCSQRKHALPTAGFRSATFQKRTPPWADAVASGGGHGETN